MSWEKDYLSVRRQMVETQLRLRRIKDPGVLAAMGEVPRELFVPFDRQGQAYADSPLPIGFGQTISQPYVVALMVEQLRCDGDCRVLDVGAGSGYQTAVLARLARWVYAAERISELTRRAEDALATMGVDNVTFATRDGSLGWPEEAPFDRIICGAAAPDVPPAWIEQLADGGRIVAPVGGPATQMVLVLEKNGEKISRRQVCGVRFVKLIGAQGFQGD
jgi:protein-L-isoaspartate(D-aspartate) O-methyltransferase